MGWARELNGADGADFDEIIGAVTDPATEPGSRRDGAAAAETVSAEAIRVLCVGSNMLQYGLVGVLREIAGGVDVAWARTVGEAAGRITHGEAFELVLVDVSVPDLAGFEGVGRLAAMLSTTPVVVTSPGENIEDVSAAIAAGARGYVPMTSRLDVLRHALPLILKGEFYVPASSFRRAASAPASATAAPAADAASPALTVSGDTFTSRQAQVLMMMAAGKSNKEIARDLQLIDGTVKLHVKAILRKLRAHNRTQAVMTAVRAGYLPRDILDAPRNAADA